MNSFYENQLDAWIDAAYEERTQAILDQREGYGSRDPQDELDDDEDYDEDEFDDDDDDEEAN